MKVIKVGGGDGIDYELFCQDLSKQQDYVLVHGGSARLNEVSAKLGHPPRFVTSVSGHESRLTDRKTLEIFNMIYAGYMNKMIVEILQRLGVNAIGLTGLDGRLVEGDRKQTLKIIENGRRQVLRGDYSGIIRKVNTKLLNLLLENGYVPVLTPPAISGSGVLSGTNFAVYDGGGSNYDPRLSYSAHNNEFLAVWSRWGSDIFGQRLSGQGV